jgi:hypothetical protein
MGQPNIYAPYEQGEPPMDSAPEEPQPVPGLVLFVDTLIDEVIKLLPQLMVQHLKDPE